MNKLLFGIAVLVTTIAVSQTQEPEKKPDTLYMPVTRGHLQELVDKLNKLPTDCEASKNMLIGQILFYQDILQRAEVQDSLAREAKSIRKKKE